MCAFFPFSTVADCTGSQMQCMATPRHPPLPAPRHLSHTSASSVWANLTFSCSCKRLQECEIFFFCLFFFLSSTKQVRRQSKTNTSWFLLALPGFLFWFRKVKYDFYHLFVISAFKFNVMYFLSPSGQSVSYLCSVYDVFCYERAHSLDSGFGQFRPAELHIQLEWIYARLLGKEASVLGISTPKWRFCCFSSSEQRVHWASREELHMLHREYRRFKPYAQNTTGCLSAPSR